MQLLPFGDGSAPVHGVPRAAGSLEGRLRLLQVARPQQRLQIQSRDRDTEPRSFGARKPERCESGEGRLADHWVRGETKHN